MAAGYGPGASTGEADCGPKCTKVSTCAPSVIAAGLTTLTDFSSNLDAGKILHTGGTNDCGTASGGAAGTCVGTAVATLPAMGTACSTAGESQCDTSGARCVCDRGIWYCNNACPASQPTPDTACIRGQACTYNNGNTGCACVNLLWTCIGVSSCPATANMPMSGQDCTGMTGVTCDYPNANPALHMTCFCTLNANAGSGSTWTCFQSTVCPSTQPPYDLSTTCMGPAICSYSSSPSHCTCLQDGDRWVCGFGYFFPVWSFVEE